MSCAFSEPLPDTDDDDLVVPVDMLGVIDLRAERITLSSEVEMPDPDGPDWLYLPEWWPVAYYDEHGYEIIPDPDLLAVPGR